MYGAAGTDVVASLVADMISEAVDAQRAPRPRGRVSMRGARSVHLACMHGGGRDSLPHWREMFLDVLFTTYVIMASPKW